MVHLCDEPFYASPVGDPALVELGFCFGEAAADGLARDRMAPLVVRAVALRGVGQAWAAGLAAGGVAASARWMRS